MRLRFIAACLAPLALAACLPDSPRVTSQSPSRQVIHCAEGIPDFALAPGRAMPSHVVPKVCACVWNRLDTQDRQLSVGIAAHSSQHVPSGRLLALGSRLDSAIQGCAGE